MFDDDTLALLPQGFDLHTATRKAIESSVAQMLKEGETFALVASADLNGMIHLGAVVRMGDHVELRGELAGHVGTREFSGTVEVKIAG
jgi:hypothetical protein